MSEELVEKVARLFRQHHRDSCYPDATDFEAEQFARAAIALLPLTSEREQIVAYLRTKLTPSGYHYTNGKWFADAIERGDHLDTPNG